VFVRGGLNIIKLSKIALIYSVSSFNLGGLGSLFGGIGPPKPPRGDGTGSSKSRFVLIPKAGGHALPQTCLKPINGLRFCFQRDRSAMFVLTSSCVYNIPVYAHSSYVSVSVI